MRQARVLVGDRFGRLTAVMPANRKEAGKYIYSWVCLCDCGREKEVLTSHLKSGATVSCGCITRCRNGATKSPIYGVWANMVRRCGDPRDKSFPDYGGRGIRVSTRWLIPENFIADMGPRPEGCTLERIDNNGPYSRDNCTWASRLTQANNKRNVPTIPWGAVHKSVAQWARDYGIPAETLRSRLKAGRTLIEAIPQLNA